MRHVTLGDTFYFKFTTRDFDTGAPQTLGGTPVISAYEDANLTQITAGITLTADYDSVTGLNHVAVVASGANGYEAGKYYAFTITTGTVDSVSVVGEVVHECVIGPVDADVREWLGTAVTTSATTSLPEVDAKSISDNAAAADNVQANIGNLDAAVSAVITDLDDVKGTGFVKDTHSLVDIEAYVDILDDGTSGNAKIATDVAAVLVDTNELQGDWTDAGRLDAILDSILAMLDDARGEPSQGTPPVNPDAMTKLDYLYKAWRNKSTQTATTYSLYADDTTTVDHKATVSDDGTTATKGEVATGP